MPRELLILLVCCIYVRSQELSFLVKGVSFGLNFLNTVHHVTLPKISCIFMMKNYYLCMVFYHAETQADVANQKKTLKEVFSIHGRRDLARFAIFFVN